MAVPREGLVLTAQDLQKAFGPRHILSGVSVSIHAGERIGLVGLNGAGKSTLAKVLLGTEQVDAGQVSRRRGIVVSALEQEPNFPPGITARDAVLSGLTAWSEAKARYDAAVAALSRGEGDVGELLAQQTSASEDVERLGGWDMSHKALSILAHLNVYNVDGAVASMSGGERRRVALAQILVSQPDFAVLDEPSNHLDVETIEWLEEYLANEYTGALLLITHDRYLLDRVATRTWEIDEGSVFSYDGGYEDYLEAKAERLALASRTEQNRQNFLRRELEWLRRQPKARTGKQKARIQRAETAKAIAPPKIETRAALSAETSRLGKTVLELKDVSLTIGDRTLTKGLNLIVGRGERIGVIGRNGTGKTTLLRAILGEIAVSRGEIDVGQNTKMAYFDQHRVGLDDALSIFDNVGGAKGRVEIGGRVLDIYAYLERFSFDRQKQRQPVGSLSGGERARVALAKLLAQRANLFLFDEPTNDLDVETLSALEEMLTEMEGSAMIVTHDRWFLNRVATSIVAFEGDGKVVRYAGTYDDYRAQKKASEEATVVDLPPATSAKSAPPAAQDVYTNPSKSSAAQRKPSKGLTYSERIELEGILEKIEAAEAAVSELEKLLADPQTHAKRGAEVPGLMVQLESAKEKAATLTARWEDLETRKQS
ncbi:MAG: ABC-F family ATP-binding cassette domain-containing protein [Polyangiaceae bacterium]|nr:ABC-F family ATP-binding cassette domain-containing protein [Polyangiaceae bacterium]